MPWNQVLAGIVIMIDDPLDAVFQQNHVKIYQEANWEIQQPKVRKDLRIVDGMKNLFAFYFDHDLSIQPQRPRSLLNQEPETQSSQRTFAEFAE